MKSKNLKSIVLALAIAGAAINFQSCSKDEALSGPHSVDTRATLVTIPANTVISTNTTWSNTNEYLLQGKVWVKAPATLTIQAGTTVRGVYNSEPLNASALVITRGAKLMANGTATNPIILTAETGHQEKGGWGGLVLLGNAQINQPANQQIEGISTGVVPSDVIATYGTNETTYNDENSGTLRYVRVEYAGAAISEANELNAFTFGGVGSGTTVEYCQAYYGADDAFEFFGGRVNARYLVATACDDDCFDFDFGYQGKIQFAVATIDADISYSKDPNGIECDNDGSGSGATPFTHPVLSNLTIVGTVDGKIAGGGIESGSNHYLYNGARFRRYTQYTLVNSIIYGYPTGVWNNTANTSTVENNVVWAITIGYKDFSNLSSTNYTVSSYNDIVLTDPFGDYYNTNALRPTGGAAVNGSYYQHTDPWFAATAYKGAIDKNPRVDSWTKQSWIK